MYLFSRNILNCFMLLAAALCFASPVSALEIEWGYPFSGETFVTQSSVAPDAVPAQSNEALEGAGLEKGFRGVSWGMSKEEMEDGLQMEFVQCIEMPGERLNCAVKGANKSIRDIPLQLLRYKFFNEVFYGISFKYNAKYEKDMYAVLKEVLGPPSDYRETFPVWHGDSFEAWATNTHFSFSSKKILKTKKHSGGTF